MISVRAYVISEGVIPLERAFSVDLEYLNTTSAISTQLTRLIGGNSVLLELAK